MKTPIYFDYAATTPVDLRVAERMASFLTYEGTFGNTSSSHPFGQQAKKAVEIAREQVAALIQADPAEIIWTSGATEANNLAIKGAAQLYKGKGKHIITLQTEHSSVLECFQYLEKEGFQITYLKPEKNGLLDFDIFRSALRDDTILVSIMHVNNELGVIQDIHEIAKITAARGVLFHVDAVQSAGKIPIDLKNTPVDLMSFSAHKIYGPKGVGALYLRRKPRVRVAAQIHGSGQESGMRSGTLPNHQIVAMGEAFQIAQNEMNIEQERTQQLRERFLQGIENLNVIYINTATHYSIPNILNIRIKGMKSEKIMQGLPELAISSGSACFSHVLGPSYVLRAIGQTTEEAQCAVRFSFGRFTTIEEIDYATESLRRLVS